MFNIGFQELLVILLVTLLLFGGRRLPELARSLGSGLKEFRSALGDIKKEVQEAEDPQPGPPKDYTKTKPIAELPGRASAEPPAPPPESAEGTNRPADPGHASKA